MDTAEPIQLFDQNPQYIGTETVKVYTRHTSDCPKQDPQWRRCKCWKYLYVYKDGKDRAISARTRSTR